HVQPGPAIAVAVRPAGRVSVTVTGPEVGAAPTFVATTGNLAPVRPPTKLPSWDLAIVMSGTRVGEAGAMALLFVGVCSPPPARSCGLRRMPVAVVETARGGVTGGKLPPGASTSVAVHDMGDSVQVQPGPATAVAVSCPVIGVRLSVTVTGPEVGPVPTFV